MDAIFPEASTMRLVCFALSLAFPLVPVALAATRETHPFDVHDLVAFDRISEPRVSPDERSVAFTVSAVDLDANKRRSDIWVARLDGTGVRKLTQHEASDTSPTWSAKGDTIYFLSTRGGSSQIWKLALDGGEAQPVTSLPVDVGSFALSRDGSSIVLSMEVFPGTTPAETK